jgi:hypothetical protein
MTTYHWTCGSGRVNLEFTGIDDCLACLGPGSVDNQVKDLSTVPEIAKQLAEIDPCDLRDCLKEYGTWDREELADHEQNLQRVLWIAACDVADFPEAFEVTA